MRLPPVAVLLVTLFTCAWFQVTAQTPPKPPAAPVPAPTQTEAAVTPTIRVYVTRVVPFARELKHEVTYKGVVLPHHYYADFVVWSKILFEAKAVEKLTEAHVKQVLNYLAAAKLELGFLVNFGADSLEWKRGTLSRKGKPEQFPKDFRL